MLDKSVMPWTNATIVVQTPFQFEPMECLRKCVFINLFLQKLSRRQYLRYIFEKKAKMYFIEGRFWSKAAVNFVSLFYWPTTHRAFVRGRTPLQRPIVPQTGRAKQDKHRCLYSSSTSNECTEDWEGSTLSMTHTRNIRDDVQQAGDPSVAVLCVRDQGFSACCNLWWTSRSWQSRTHAERRLSSSEIDTTRPWLRLSCAASGKVELVSVHLCVNGHRVSPTSPRLERGVTFGVGQRKERKLLCPKPLRALRIPSRVVLRSGSTFHGETALRLLLRRRRKALLCL